MCREEYKKAFIFERTTLMLSFYMLLNDLYNKEVIFLQKLILIVYSNIYCYIELLVSFI